MVTISLLHQHTERIQVGAVALGKAPQRPLLDGFPHDSPSGVSGIHSSWASLSLRPSAGECVYNYSQA